MPAIWDVRPEDLKLESQEDIVVMEGTKTIRYSVYHYQWNDHNITWHTYPRAILKFDGDVVEKSCVYGLVKTGASY